VYGIKAAVRRLDYAPDLKAMEVKDITNGRFVFPPLPGKPVGLAALRKTIQKAGYEMEGTWIEVSGTLTADGQLRVPETGQLFRLEGEPPGQAGASVTVAGAWKDEKGQQAIEIAAPQAGEVRP
jgi:hypothetical protein